MRTRIDARDVQHVRLTELASIRELMDRAAKSLATLGETSDRTREEMQNFLAVWVEVPLNQAVQLIDELQTRIRPEEADDGE